MGDFNTRPEGFHYFDRENNTKIDLIKSSLLAVARNNFESKFSRKDFPDDLDEIEIEIKEKRFLDILSEATNESFSRSELKRLIKDNAVEINGVKFTSLEILPTFKSPWKIKLGKRNFYKIKIK